VYLAVGVDWLLKSNTERSDSQSPFAAMLVRASWTSTRFRVTAFPLRGFAITLLDTSHLVGLPCTDDQPDAETSTWHHTTNTGDIPPCPRRDSNQQSEQPPRLRPCGRWDRLLCLITLLNPSKLKLGRFHLKLCLFETLIIHRKGLPSIVRINYIL